MAEDARRGMAGNDQPYRTHNEKELVAAPKRGDHQNIINGDRIPAL